jgi:hypothetical protein
MALQRPVRIPATTTAFLKGCSCPCWDVTKGTIHLMDEILSINYKYTLSTIDHKLKVSGHRLTWTFLVFVVRKSRPKVVCSFQLHLYNLWSCVYVCVSNSAKLIVLWTNTPWRRMTEEIMFRCYYPMHYILERSSSSLGRIAAEGRAPSTHCIESRFMNIYAHVRFEIFTAVAMQNAPSWIWCRVDTL